MTDQKPVLLLPGPDSVAAASHFFGDAYEYVSYLTEHFIGGNAKTITNGALTPLNKRRVDIWPVPPRFWNEANAGLESILRKLMELDCQLRVVAMSPDDEQYEPFLMRAAGIDRAAGIAWARAHIKPVELPPPEPEPPVPRETPTRGKPRSRPDGAPAAAKSTQIEADGSAFVSWQRLGLECTQNGQPYPHISNAQKILANHPAVIGRIWYDEFHDRIFQTLFHPTPTEWSDVLDTRLTAWIQSALRIPKMAIITVQRAVEDYAAQNVRNEVREWMDGLVWDETKRLPTLMADAFGADQNDYTAAVGRCWFVSMAARTYSPGCKVDTMPVFEGPQGIRKSSALAVIGGKWFAEMHEDITTKDFKQNLPGKLLLEISELHSFRRAEINKIKGVISDPCDRYRASYGRKAADHPRRGVWAGTTNRDDWVEDETGARRTWPIKCTEVDLDYLREMREQLFAEAVHRFKAGEPWWDIDSGLAKQETDARVDDDAWTERVLDYISLFTEIRVPMVLEHALHLPPERHDKSAQMRVARILKLSGYDRKTALKAGRLVKIWVQKK